MPPRKVLKWAQKVQHFSLSPKGPSVGINRNLEPVYVGGTTSNEGDGYVGIKKATFELSGPVVV